MSLFTRVVKSGQVNYQDIKVYLKEVEVADVWIDPTPSNTSEDLGETGSEMFVQIQELLQSAENEAAEIIAKAKQEAYELGEKVKNELAAYKELATQEGRREGYRDGHQEGKQAALSEAESLISEAKEIIKLAADKHDALMKDSQSELIQLAVKIAGKILDKELKEDPGSVCRTVRKALQFTSQRENLVLRICPEDVKQLSKAKLLELGIPDVKIVEDPLLRSGDCLLDGVLGRIDATLNAQLTAVHQKLEVIAGG